VVELKFDRSLDQQRQVGSWSEAAQNAEEDDYNLAHYGYDDCEKSEDESENDQKTERGLVLKSVVIDLFTVVDI
jgi:hypothetical protein